MIKDLTKKKHYSYAILFLLIYTFVLFFHQPINRINDGAGNDGFIYQGMAEDPNYYSGVYSLRLFVITLVRLISLPIKTTSKFMIVNVFFAFLYMLMIFKILKLLFPNYHIRILLIVLFMIVVSEESILRFSFLCPNNTDASYLFFSATLTFFILKITKTQHSIIQKKYKYIFYSILFFILFFLGSLSREVFFIHLGLLGILFIKGHKWPATFELETNKIIETLGLILSSFLGLLLSIYIFDQLNLLSAYIEHRRHLSKVDVFSTKILRVTVSFMFVYFTFLWIILLSQKKKACLQTKEKFIMIQVLIICFLAIYGAGDHERLLAHAYHFVAILVTPHLNSMIRSGKYMVFSVIFVLHLVINRTFFPLKFLESLCTGDCSLQEIFTGLSPMIFTHWIMSSDTIYTLFIFFVLVTVGLYLMNVRFVIQK